MIEKVCNKDKALEVGINDVAYIEFFKRETGNIDMFLGKDRNSNTRAIEGFFIGDYEIEYNREVSKVEDYKQNEIEQLDLFSFM
ncbi:MAG: hypothetical protein ACTIJG_03225 [Staphylococcus saprophyticus]